jgi:hypothetical protein
VLAGLVVRVLARLVGGEVAQLRHLAGAVVGRADVLAAGVRLLSAGATPMSTTTDMTRKKPWAEALFRTPNRARPESRVSEVRTGHHPSIKALLFLTPFLSRASV